MKDALTRSTPRSFWIISGVALAWNLLGVATYLMHVTMPAAALAEMSEAERALYTGAPPWVTGVYAIAVFGGTLGAVGLLLRKTWATPVFVVSLAGILAQMGYTLLVQDTIAVKGGGVVVMPLIIIAIAVYLVWFSRSAARVGHLGKP